LGEGLRFPAVSGPSRWRRGGGGTQARVFSIKKAFFLAIQGFGGILARR